MNTIEQNKIIARIEKMKDNNKIRQQRYRDNHKNDENFKEERAKYQRDYQKDLKEKYNKILGIIDKIEPIKEIDIKEIIRPSPISKRNKRYQNKNKIITDIKPAFIDRKTPLEQSSIIEYIKKLNIIHKHLTSKPLDVKLKTELNKVIGNNEYNEDYILSNMPYLEDVEKLIENLRAKYSNDNSFKSYLIPLIVILSHIKSYNNQYQIITKIAKKINDDIQKIRGDNVLPNNESIKIIDLDKETILSNLNLLTNIQDKLIYGLYCLFPSRREDDYRLMKITYSNNPDNLDNEYNYLQIEKNKINFIFNQFKTVKKFGQQIFQVPKILDDILINYIQQNKLKELDYLFYTHKNPKDKTSQSNFSTKISNTFKKVYGIPISIRYIRKSHATYLYNTAYKNKWSTNEINKYQDMMAHSKGESELYRVIK
jgi:hypothetical protein